MREFFISNVTSYYHDLRDLHQKLGNNDKVIETYEALIEFDPSVSNYTDLCNLYQELGDEKKRVETARNALKNANFNEDAELHMNNFFAIIQEYERKNQNDDIDSIEVE